MAIRTGRVVIAAIAAEVLAIVGLICIVAVWGPSEPDAARAFAQRVGFWFGPAAGFGLCLAAGWLVSRPLAQHQMLNGFALGATVAAIDAALILASAAPFHAIFVASNIGRMLAGTLGGWLASLGDSAAE